MDMENTSQRLNQIMRERNLRQVDVLNLCKPYCKKYGVKMNKSDLSQYLAGKFLPKQDKLTVLAMGLNVSETWLMGYDVGSQRDPGKTGVSEMQLSSQEKRLIEYYRLLNEEGQSKVTSYVDDLTDMNKYTQDRVDEVVENGA